MAYDEGLAERIRGVLDEQPGVSEKRMFGGVAFLVKGHMSVGIVQDKLMVRVGPESYDRVLRERHARKMDFTGRPMKGFVYVIHSGYETDADLQRWVRSGGELRCLPPGQAPEREERAAEQADAADEVREGEAARPSQLIRSVGRAWRERDRVKDMRTTIEAEVDEKGNIRPKEPVTLTPGSQLLITVVGVPTAETALLSEAALATDWNRPEEDAAWADLGPAQ